MSESDVVVRQAKSPLQVTSEFLQSSVGAKVVMGITGLGLWGFVLTHMLGNLQVFQGAEALNAYGHFLQTSLHGAGVWILRAGLAGLFVLHIFFGIRLAAKNRDARPVAYKAKKSMRTNLASLSMATTGLLILAFVVFHILHFTTGNILPELHSYTETVDGVVRHDVFKMVVGAFKMPLIVAIYVIGQTILLSHLTHGTVSLWQSIGWHHPVWTPALKVVGRGLAVFIFAGNIGIPLAIFLFWK